MEILEINRKRANSQSLIHLNSGIINHRSLNFINIEKRNLLKLYKELLYQDHDHHQEEKLVYKNKKHLSSINIHPPPEKIQSENEIGIQRLISSIELIPNKEEKSNNYLGSLYNLFDSQYFDIHLLLYYLDKKDEQGIVDVLMNIMNKKFINESFFYIPQLCTLITYKPYYESLENYILDRCVDQIKFSLKIYWLINSYSESAEEYKIIKKYDKLVQRIEMTLVNGRRATISSFKLYNSLNIKSEEEVYKHSLDKEFRLTYFEKTNKFYQELKCMCQKLKDFPKENKYDPKMTRNSVMRKQLLKFNKNIRNMFSYIDENTKTTTKSFYRGYILPFDDAISTMDDYNSLIVNFLPEYSFCFSTKARVPVKITVECVRVLECAYWDELIIEGQVGGADDLNFLEEDEDEQAANLQTEENNKIEATNMNYSGGDLNNSNFYYGGQNIEMVPVQEVKVNEYSSIEDFFKKVSTSSIVLNSNKTKINNSNLNPFSNNSENNSKEKKENEIKQIVDNIKKANENEFYSPIQNIRMTIRKDSVLSELNFPAKEENFLYDDSEETINPFGARWSDSIKKIKEKSRFRNFETYSVKSFIAKANDDLRQEVMTMQLIKRFDDVFKLADIPLKLRPYEILITSSSSGLIEFLPNTISIDALKKNLPDNWNLNMFFRKFFTNNFEEAQKNFAESLAAYSLISYMIAIRDRHNGNILLDMNGNLIHIDFGFILGISPGNLNFENAPFKLTQEYVDILDGPDSNIFHYFKSLILRGLMELKKHVDSFEKIVDIMARGSKMPCFINTDVNFIITKFTERFHKNKSESEYIQLVDELIYNSINNWRTVQYDYFQKLTNDIRP